MVKKRIGWIDEAKGIGILLVILGHTNPPFKDFIFWFHVPLLFILSGITLKTTNSYNDFIVKKIRRLIFPYFIYGFIVIIMNFLILSLIGEVSVMNFLRNLIALLYGGEKAQGIIGAFWFLPVLAIAVIALNYTLNKFSKTTTAVLILFIYVCSFLFIDLSKITFDVPMDLLTIPLATLFIYIGYLYKLIKSKSLMAYQLLFLVVIASCLFFFFPSFKFDMKNLVLNNIVLDIIIPVTFSFIVIIVCRLISEYINGVPFMQVLGKNSLQLMLVHNFFISLLTHISKNWFFLFLGSTMLSIVVCFFIEKFKEMRI